MAVPLAVLDLIAMSAKESTRLFKSPTTNDFFRTVSGGTIDAIQDHVLHEDHGAH